VSAPRATCVTRSVIRMLNVFTQRVASEWH
jgi:hypothetical protein